MRARAMRELSLDHKALLSESIFAGDVGALHAPLSTSLTIAMQKAREALGAGAGEALGGTSGRVGMKRGRDLSADYASDSESEGE